MLSSASETRKERVNLLLPSPFDKSDLKAGLSSSSRAERREAVAEVESLDTSYRTSNAEIAHEICARLAGEGEIGVASATTTGSRYLTIDQLDPHIGPPDSMAVFNPYTAVLTMVGPEGVEPAEMVEAVHKRVRDLAPAAERTASHRAVAAMDRSLRVEPEIIAAPPSAVEGVWLEAALEAAAAETIPWGVNQVRAPSAWQLGALGQGVAVAVVDTGIAPHLDLAAPIRGFSFIPGSQSYYDDHGHGTHVAGTIAALRGNGRGVVGVAPLASLIAVKVLARDGFSRGDSVALGITWAANNGARVINLSLGSRDPSESVNRAVLYAQSRHVVVCAAAGNDYGAPVSYPAAFQDICIAVAATDRTNRRAIFSNVGPELDVSAPGVEVLSTYLSNGYRTLQGTSMATPHVSGVAALVLGRYPALSPSGVKEQLERTALSLGPPTEYGRGLIQADRAVAAPPAPSTPPLQPARVGSETSADPQGAVELRAPTAEAVEKARVPRRKRLA